MAVDENHFEDLVLGHMVEATMKGAEQIKRQEKANPDPLRNPEKLFVKPFTQAMSAFKEQNLRQAKTVKDAFSELKPLCDKD